MDMLKHASHDLKKTFLREFTKELISTERKKISGSKKVQHVLEKQAFRLTPSTKLTKEIKNIEFKESFMPSIMNTKIPQDKMTSGLGPSRRPIKKENILNKFKSFFSSQPQQRFSMSQLRPTPTSQKIDLGTLTPYLKDQTVTAIECKGPNTNLIVKRLNESRNTNLKLDNKQIQEVINAFSKESKIPINSGTFRVAVGELSISAIISKAAGSKFIINKLAYQ